MEIPLRLEDWTLELLEDLVAKGVPESDRHDFKFALNERKSSKWRELICSFANTKGGFIIFGVQEKGVEPNKSFKIVGNQQINISHDLAQICKHIEPTILIEGPRTIQLQDQKCIYIFHIKLSPYRPHIPIASDDTRVFIKRIAGGTAVMTMTEIREAILRYEEKVDKLALFYVDLVMNKEELNQTSKEIEAIINKMQVGKIRTPFIGTNSLTMNKLLVETIGIVGKSKKFIKTIYNINNKLNLMQQDNEFMRGQLTLQLSNNYGTLADYLNTLRNQLSSIQVDYDSAIKTLEDEFGVVNPLK